MSLADVNALDRPPAPHTGLTASTGFRMLTKTTRGWEYDNRR